MKKIILLLGLSLGTLTLTSCEDFLNEIDAGGTNGESGKTSIAEGLKEALRVGTDTAVSRLTASDGYFKDEAIKLLLPPQGDSVMSKLKNSQNPLVQTAYTSIIKGLEDDMILALNRAAEDAAKDAKPIFVDAITGISIADANNILFGGDTTAATTYLKTNTFNNLKDVYSPKMDASLDKDLGLGFTANSAWDNLVGKYNGLFEGSTIAEKLTATAIEAAGFNKIAETDLSDYATGKALDGLFVKVADEESAIRQDPLARVNDILTEIFGKLD